MASVEVVDSVNATGSSYEIAFSGISGDFKHLELRGFLRSKSSTSTDPVHILINGSTANYYMTGFNSGFNSSSGVWTFRDASGATELGNNLGPNVLAASASAGCHTQIEVWFGNYADSTTQNAGIYKWYSGDNLSNSSLTLNPIGVAGWHCSDFTGAVTSIAVRTDNSSDHWTDTSWVTLYGWRG